MHHRNLPTYGDSDLQGILIKLNMADHMDASVPACDVLNEHDSHDANMSLNNLLDQSDAARLTHSLLKRMYRGQLRAASSSARSAVNATVTQLEVAQDERDLDDLHKLRLHERFPNLEKFYLKQFRDRVHFSYITTFVLETLAKLPSLAAVDLSGSRCRLKDSHTSWLRALSLCKQLKHLTLLRGEATWSQHDDEAMLARRQCCTGRPCVLQLQISLNSVPCNPQHCKLPSTCLQPDVVLHFK